MATPQRPLRPITPDALASYLADVRRTPLRSPDAEAALGRRIVQGDEHARHEFVEHNSLDAPLTEEGDIARLDVLSAESLPSSEAAYVSAAMRQEVHDLLARLAPRQAAILRARFGFDGEPKSLAEIGRAPGLSRERVRQIEAQARRQLYALAKEKALDDYLN